MPPAAEPNRVRAELDAVRAPPWLTTSREKVAGSLATPLWASQAARRADTATSRCASRPTCGTLGPWAQRALEKP